MPESRKIAAILAADVVGYSRLASADEDRTLARLRALRSDLIDPTVAVHNGRVVKRTGDGSLVEFRSVVDAVRCAIEVQNGMVERNAGLPPERRIEFRVGIHLGDVVEESDGDLMGAGVNIAARLEGIAKPGAICLSEDAYRQVKGRLDLPVRDLGEIQLKNIAEPIRAYALEVGNGEKAMPVASEGPSRRLALPDKPSIAVLPFQNMSGDTEQEYFCDGMVEDVITGLSRIKWLFVIARNSTFTYKGRAIDVKQVGRDLGVRYVLEGSVRKSGNRVRITSQLVEAETGRHMWAERYDRPLDDIFALQDEITLNVVGAIEPSLRQAEIERVKRERPENLGAYDLVLRAMPDVYTGMTEEANKALQLLDRALALEPEYALAHGYAAWCHEIRFVRAGPTAEDRDAAIRHAYAAIANGPDDATALAIAGFVIAQIAHDMSTARKAFEQALAISPSSFIALALGAVAVAWKGDTEHAIEWGERAIRVSPFDRLLYLPFGAIAISNFMLRRYEKAAEAARRTIQSKPEFSILHVLLAAALAAAGQQDEAQEAAARALALQPGFSPRAFCAALAIPPSLATPFSEALRTAGLPD